MRRHGDDRTLDLFAIGPDTATFAVTGDHLDELSLFAQDAESTAAEFAVRFTETLAVPQGPNAGKPVPLAPFYRQFIAGAMAPDTSTAILSIGRGNGKSAITADLALGGPIGVWDRQPRREIIAAAWTRDAFVGHAAILEHDAGYERGRADYMARRFTDELASEKSKKD